MVAAACRTPAPASTNPPKACTSVGIDSWSPYVVSNLPGERIPSRVRSDLLARRSRLIGLLRRQLGWLLGWLLR